ncbi:MAG: sporulation protein YqfD, partial [Moorella sp. (in: Bacteria)]|nr:sporulation protein YqfD [Moorella sp. (in: firmicutes)]
MAWRNWLAYLEGYIVLDIAGADPEKFLNLALARGIGFWDIIRREGGSVEAKMAAGDFYILRSLARESGCRVRIVDKRGWPFFLRRLRRRHILVAGGFFFLLALYFLSSFIWVVDVRTAEGPLRHVTPAHILAAARAEGLRPGARKSSLDIRTLERALENRLPQLAWVGVSFHGTRAEITVVEKVAAPQEDADQPASIIATKDGIIKEILVISGEGRVKAGETVRQGEVLISGLILPPQPEKKPGETASPAPSPPQPRLVRARGIVRARVWYEGVKEISRRQVQEVPTGRQQTAVTLRTTGRRFLLKGPAGCPYTYCHQEKKVIALPAWRNFSLPVELIFT